MKSLTLIVTAVFLAAVSCSGKTQLPEPKDPVVDPEKKEEQKQEAVSLDGKNFLVCANSMVYYGGLVQKGDPRYPDTGMLYRMLLAGGAKNFKVYDCTYGGHHLYDFAASGCQTSGGGCPGVGEDLLKGIDLSKIDYVIISEAGNNYDHFYNDAWALYRRVTSVNPSAKLYYINHIYSVYKKHNNVLGNLKTLHDNLGVTIINCGQLAYDIYTKAVKVPGGSMTYTDRYTFCNNKSSSSDYHHPNPLMGYIMTQMLWCALTGEKAEGQDYMSFVRNCKYGGGSTTYDNYYSTYYESVPNPKFSDVLDNAAEMKGIQQLIPSYINKY